MICQLAGVATPRRTDRPIALASALREHQYAWVAVLLDLGSGDGDGLLLSAERHVIPGDADPLFDVSIQARALPFSGTVTELLTVDDLARLRAQLVTNVPPTRLVLGGGRAAELVLDVEPQTGGAPSKFVVEATLVRSGDDPWPMLRWLMFNQAPFWTATATAIDALLQQ